MILETSPPVETWQIWSALRRIVGDTELIKIFKVEIRQLQRWSADPGTTESASANPDDRYEKTLAMLMDLGRKDIARIRAARVAHIAGCELICLDGIAPDKCDLRDEMLDDYPVVAAFHDAMREGKSPAYVSELCRAAKKELDETMTAYLKKHPDES